MFSLLKVMEIENWLAEAHCSEEKLKIAYIKITLFAFDRIGIRLSLNI